MSIRNNNSNFTQPLNVGNNMSLMNNNPNFPRPLTVSNMSIRNTNPNFTQPLNVGNNTNFQQQYQNVSNMNSNLCQSVYQQDEMISQNQYKEELDYNHNDINQINSYNQMNQINSPFQHNDNNQIQNINNQQSDNTRNNININKKIINNSNESNQIQRDINSINMQSNDNNDVNIFGLTNYDIKNISFFNGKVNTLKISIDEYEENKQIRSHLKEIENDTVYIFIGRKIPRNEIYEKYEIYEEKGKMEIWDFNHDKSLSKLHCMIYRNEDQYFIRAESSSNKSFRFLNMREQLIMKNGIEFFISLNSFIYNVKVDQTNNITDVNDGTYKGNLELNIAHQTNQNDEYNYTIDFKCNNYSKYGHLISQFINEKEILIFKSQANIIMNQPFIYYDDDLESFVLDRNGFKDDIWLKLVEDASKKEIYDIIICKGDKYKLANNLILNVDNIEYD